MSNRLKNQSSPYLLQHADNPVDWYPWGEEAFEKAEREDKPVFLSVGYSTCHWCHVMARESFEDDEIAEILNRDFVSVKVDREERPDIDNVYMEVCQALTGSGGWPMSIFMTAQQKPFFAGTYFPPESHYGMAGFRDLLLLIAQRWKENRAELLQSAENILAHINTAGRRVRSESINRGLPEMAARSFSAGFDEKNGGFWGAPKFPMPHNLLFLILYSQLYHDRDALRQVRVTLEKMRRGGIFDHIGYGFSRYSTDPYYLVPHFEKMLYDNALLMMAYCAAYRASRQWDFPDAEIFLDTAEKTAEYVFREMTGPDGGFYSAQDADSEGEEGRYYVWSYDEICGILGRQKGSRFCGHFGITEKGNFEGKSIPNLLHGNKICDDFERERSILYRYRKSRAALPLDDKILTSWNSLMICAMALLYRVTGKQQYLLAAQKAQALIEKRLAEGNILYVSCRGRAEDAGKSTCADDSPGRNSRDDGKIRSVKGFLEEYAYYTAALISLYDITSETVYLERAEQICGEAEKQFADENGGYFLYGSENSLLITKPKETYDGALPSGNSVMAYCLVRLAQITGKDEYRTASKKQSAFLSAQAEHAPTGHGMFLFSLLFYFYPPQKITAVLSEEDSADHIISRLPLYADVQLLAQETEEYKRLDGRTTFYVCKDFMCLPPTTELPLLFTP